VSVPCPFRLNYKNIRTSDGQMPEGEYTRSNAKDTFTVGTRQFTSQMDVFMHLMQSNSDQTTPAGGTKSDYLEIFVDDRWVKLSSVNQDTLVVRDFKPEVKFATFLGVQVQVSQHLNTNRFIVFNGERFSTGSSFNKAFREAYPEKPEVADKHVYSRLVVNS